MEGSPRINTTSAGVISCSTKTPWGSAMTSEDLRRKNASLHDRIEQVLEMHPELREVTEAIALSQDLHVEVGAPFLERTRDKLLERGKMIIERRPELEYYFDDLIPRKVRTTPREPSSKPRSKQTLRFASRPSG